MDLKTLRRDKTKVRNILVKMSDGSVVAKEGCNIYIPQRYVNKGLAGIGERVWSVGTFVIAADNGCYCTMLLPIAIVMQPTEIKQIKMDDVHYYDCRFEPGSIIMENVLVEQTDNYIGDLFGEYVIGANLPHGFNLLDLIKVFSLAGKYAKFKVGSNHQVFETVVNIMARDKDDLNKQYRYRFNSIDDLYTSPPWIVGLRNAAITSTNTSAKLVGSYFDDGTVSALINPATRLEGVEEVLRR